MTSHTTQLTLGWIFRLLGYLGVLLCLAACGSAWYAGIRMNMVAKEIVVRVDDELTTMGDMATDTRNGIELTRKVAREVETELRLRVKERVEEALTPSPEAMAKITELDQKLDRGFSEVQLWITRVQEILAVADQLMIELENSQLFQQTTPQKLVDLHDRLEEVMADVSAIEEAVQGLDARINELREGKLPSPDLPEIGYLSDRIDKSLINLEQYAETIETAISTITNGLEEIRVKLRNRILGSLLLATLLALWQGGAQLALARYGKELIGCAKT